MRYDSVPVNMRCRCGVRPLYSLEQRELFPMVDSSQAASEIQAGPKSSRHLVNPALLEGLDRGFSAGSYAPPTVADMNKREPNRRFEERTISGLPGSPPVQVVVIT